MQTDYKNLNWFEALTVAMIAMGILLIGGITLSNLDRSAQKNFTSSLAMFDLNEPAVVEMDAINFLAFEALQDFFQQFYVAFAQVASIPEPDLGVVVDTAVQVQDFIASLTNPPDMVAVHSASGRVAGVAIVNEQLSSPESKPFIVYQPPKVDWRPLQKFLMKIK